MTDQDVVVTERAGATWIRLNTPGRRNAFDPEMLSALTAAVKAAAATDVTAIVITGTDDAFCAGGFLDNLADPDVHALRSMFFGCLELMDQIRSAPQPVIAAVNGVAAGGGNELVVACDLAIAVESAWLGQTGPKVGSAPVLGGTNMLTMNVGEKRAKEISFLCRRYTAQEAHDLGWVNTVVPDGGLEEAVDAMVAELATKSPRYLEIAKLSSNVWWNASRDNFQTSLGMLVQAIGSKDMREGAQAFKDKRRPSFHSRGDI